jgi:ribonuclease P protein component
VLPAAARMRARTEFAATVRGGRRGTSPTVTVHVGAAGDGATPPHVGFVVTRGVGPAVVRNRVRRRLRHLMRDRLDRLPSGSSVVVRANPAAVGVSCARLAGDLDRALERAAGRAGSR